MTRKNLIALDKSDILHVISKVFDIPEYDMKLTSYTDPYYGDYSVYLEIETESNEKANDIVKILNN